MKIVFLGTPDFAVYSLAALCENGYKPMAVISQPDRPKGRGNQLLPSPAKVYALENGIPVFQFESIKSKEGVECLRELVPDLMVTAAFGQILSQEVLDIPPLGCVNVHASLLPKLRGAAPIQWAILNGDKTTGITTMYTELGVDCGDMILQNEIGIENADTSGSLFAKLGELGAKTISDTVRLIEKGTAPRIKQNEREATKCGIIHKDMAKINWTRPAEEINRQVRAFNPSPGAFTALNGERIKIWETKIILEDCGACGEVVISGVKEGLAVQCGGQLLNILQLQLAGGKKMSANEFLRGREIPQGTVFGED